ncbi:MAG: hypothetical protein II098_06625 [Treponema sp.]|nr:hypothetical protein [Treponema sp.]
MKKNFFNKLIFLIFISCMFFSNCSFSGDDDNTVLKAAVLLSMNNNAVSPDKVRVNLNFETPRGGTILSTQELRDLIFSGAREGGGICNVTGSTKNELCSKEIWLQTGSWSFELEGTIDGVTFKDSVSMNISQINTTIEFNLRPYDGNEAISKGGLYFVLNFSGDADYALLNIKDAVTGTVIETDKKIKGFDVVKKIEYSKTFKGQDSEGLTPGTYKLTVDFYRNDMNTDEPPLNTWEAYARIKAGLTARKEISDFDLTDSYRITYHVPSGATISAAGVVVLCYSRKSDTITLPVYTNAGFKVLSWYETENFNISQPGVTSFNPKTKLKNMDFYPLWDTDTGYVTAGGTGNGLSAESAASSAATALTNLKKLHEYGSEQTNLKIQIDGEVSGNTTIDTDYNYVDSITLKGKTGNSTDSLKGSGSNSVLKLECEKSVTITNLKITGGSGVNYGGGIYVGGKSSVILEDGALIDGNSAVQRGGGIYVSANTGTVGRISLTINDGAKITGNKIVNDGTGEYGGMGIFAESAKIVMNGGEISQNNGQQLNQRGAVRLHTNCVFDLNGGKITNNSVMHIGGNIFCRASTINMTAGEISEGKAGNESQHGAGGGLWIEKESPFNMSGGIICNNSVNQKTGSSGGAINLRNDGAKLCISGSAYIPSSGTAFDNDIYIQDKDGTYTAIEISGELTPPSEYVAAGKKIAVSPAGWKRRKVILKAADDAPTGLNIEDYKNYFCFTSNGVNFSYGTDNTAIIMAPYFVASSGTDDDDTPGDSDNPYRTIKYAVGKLSGNYDETIKVKGILKGASEIPDTFSTTNCKSLTIEGASNLDSDGNPQDVLTIADDAASGSVLKINTEVPVTLKNIKITGGKGTPDSDNEVNTFGGGIYFEKGSLTLADGVLITGNSATVSGGGIYMPLRDAKLFMCGTSYVGDKRTTTATGTTVNDAGTNCANFAANSGGGIYSCGKVYLGYIQNSSGNIVPESWTGGICGNAASKGAGITSGRDTAGSTPESGLLKVMTGKISYNYAGSGSGGGIYAYDGTVVEFYNGEIDDNSAENGGAIYADGAATKISVSGGKLSQNTASSCGGAINYNNGTIEVSGSVYIPCTGEKQNDVYLAENKFLTIAGNLTLPEDAPSNAKNMLITPSAWTRGNQVLGASSAGLIESNKDRFATIDEDFIINQKSGELTKGVLAAPIYVASDDVYDDTRCGNKGSSSGARGTREKPYSSLETAFSEVDASNYTIYIDGTLKGKVEIKEDGSSPINSNILTLRGYIPDGQTVAKAALDGNFSSMENGNTTLVITAEKTVNIYDLKITGGKNSYKDDDKPSGGGIIINNAGTQVNLESGTVITGNNARYGGGVTVWNGKLTVKDGAVISNNKAIRDGNYGGKGGGIYVENGSVELAGGTIGGSSSEEGNSAYQGGGIYVSYVSGDTSEAFTMTGGRVSYNNRDGGTGVHGGAGLYLWRKSTISGGKIDHNNAATDSEGGGIYVDAVCTISGDVEISDNRANKGAGIYTNKDDLTVEGGVFKNNIAGTSGGAIYVWNDFNLKGNPVFTLPEDGVGQGKNDIYLKQGEINITGSVTTSDIYIASVTPSHYSRGERILSSTTTQNKTIMDSLMSRFILTQDDGDWNRKNSVYEDSTETTYFIIIDSPIYVVGNGHDSYFKDAPASGAIGTKSKPYASIFDAQAVMSDSNMDYELVVDGSVTGPQKLSYADKNFNAKSVTIKGYKPTDTYSVTATLNGNSTTGSALTVAAKTADFPVIIQDLTITGGNATDGGGINISKGTVKLTDGTKITGNTATKGGGVYVGSDGTLFMYGKALIGDVVSGSTATTKATSLSFANKASYGGGIYSEGNVYLGYNAWGTTSGTAEPLDSGYGVRRNYSTGDYAGIYGSGTVRIKTGNISYNTAASNGGGLCGNFILEGGTVSGNSASNGAGMYIPNGITTSSITNGTVSSNVAVNNGGAAYISNGGKLSLSGGTISANEATNGGAVFTYYYTSSSYGTFEMNGGTLSENSATGHGGAVYVDTGALFKMSGSASIPPVLHTTLENYYIVNQNDVYLAKNSDGSERAAITVTGSILLSAESPVAAVTPAECKRGIAIVKNFSSNTLVSGTNGKFAITEYDDDWTKKQASDNKSVTIESDVYVASSATTDSTRKVCGPAPSSGNIGTKHKPYKSIEDALGLFNDDTADAKVIVDGTLTGAQKIVNATAKSITVQGYRESDTATTSAATLNGGFTKASKGTTLTIDASGVISVTLRYLTITGGYASNSGGGVCVMDGSLANLAEGVAVTGNAAASYGGGVFVQAGAALGVYANGTGTSVTIGKAGVTDAPVYNGNAEPSATGINQADEGGGIYNAGELRFGGSVAKRTDGVSGATGSIYATGNINICGNVAKNYGGGIYATGRVYGGTSAYNATRIEAGTIKCNRADQGGGVYIADGKCLYMNRGIFELNKAGTSGGAVYQGGTFYLFGKSQMAATTNAEKTNDVYLPSGKLVTVYSSINTVSTNGPLFSGATITPESWTRGTQVLEKGSSLSAGLDADIVGKFTVSDSEWSPILVGSGTSAIGKIDAEIWVAGGTLSTGVGNKVTGGKAPSNDNRGTKLQPYATLAKAVAQCWKGPNDTVATTGRTINIDGTVQGSGDNAHTISDTDLTSAKATAVTLLGNGTNGATLSRSAAGGRVLYITSAVPVTIKKLTITGGNTTGTGAGICVSAPNAKLTLGQGAVVTGNEGNGNGGGVYFEGTSSSKMGTLTMESTAKIQGNKSNLSNGGGIYLKYAKLYMRGSALVGDNSTSYTVGATNSSKSNSAVSGGGIYADEYGYVYIGEESGDSALGASYGVCHNYASSDGGGVYLATSTSILKMGSGKISKNGAAVNGGGVYNAGIVYLYTDALIGDAKFTASTATATDTAHSNLAGGDGGGIFSVGGSYVGLGYSLKNGSSWTEKTLNEGYGVVGNYAAGSGGGIQCNDNSVSAMELHMASGDISANRANGSSEAAGGGGIHVNNSSTNVYMTGGKIAKNSAVTGGGVHLNGNIYMSGSAAIGDMSKGATTYASSATACSNYASSKGGGVFVDTNGDLSMGYKNAVANNYDTAFSGGIAYNYSGMGGGIYTKATAGVHLAYGTVKSNGANYSGGGVFMTYWLVIAKATIPGGSSDKQNGVCFNSSGSPQIDGISGVAPTESQVAKITPGSYSTSTQVLSSRLYPYADKFYVFPKDGVNWSIDSSTGKLKQN